MWMWMGFYSNGVIQGLHIKESGFDAHRRACLKEIRNSKRTIKSHSLRLSAALCLCGEQLLARQAVDQKTLPRNQARAHAPVIVSLEKARWALKSAIAFV